MGSRSLGHLTGTAKTAQSVLLDRYRGHHIIFAHFDHQDIPAFNILQAALRLPRPLLQGNGSTSQINGSNFF